MLVLRRSRRGQEPRGGVTGSALGVVDEHRAVSCMRELGGREQGLRACLRGRIEHLPVSLEDLREAFPAAHQLAWPRVSQPRVRLLNEGENVGGPRAKALIDRAVEVRPEADIEE